MYETDRAEHLKTIKAAAKKLGLVNSGQCIFQHPDLPLVFDLSACNPEKIMLYIYQETIRVGRNAKANEILDALQPE